MEVLIKLNSQAAGRDKLARIVQYSSRFIWCELQNTNCDRYSIDQLKRLELTCSSFRKLLRFGKCIDALYSILPIVNYPNIVVRVTLTLSKLANSVFLFADHVVWLARSGFLKNIDSNRWLSISNRYWLLTIIINLVRDIYEVQKILFNERSFIFQHDKLHNGRFILRKYLEILRRALSVVHLRKDVVTDVVKNFCDVWIPLNALGRVNLKPSTVGLLGAVSSVAALIAILQPSAKLSPA